MLSRVLAVTASVLGVGALVLGPTIPAAAAEVTYVNVGTGGDVDYLPSTQLDKYDGMTDNQRLNQMAQDAYASMKTQQQTDSVVRFTGGTGITTTTSPGQVQQYIETVDGELIDDAHEIQGQTTRVRGAGAFKALGIAGEAIGGYAIGTGLVNGVGSLIGIDPAGYVCENTGADAIGSLVRLIDGASCAQPLADSYEPNSDIIPGMTYSPVCNSNGSCFQISGTPYTYKGDQWFNGYVFTAVVQCTSAGTDASCTPSRVNSNGLNWVQCQRGGTWSLCNLIAPSTSDPRADYCYANSAKICLFDGADAITRGIRVVDPTTGTPGQTSTGQYLPSNPTRTLKCVTLGSDGKNYAGDPLTYNDNAGIIPTPECADLPAGVLPSKVTVERTTDGKTETDTLGSWDTDQDVLDWAKQYPACTVHSLCSLSLQTKTANGWSTCKDGDDKCGDWFTSPSKDDTYRCVYGIPGSQSTVNLSECDIYQNRFTPEAQKSGDTLTDPTTGKPLSNPKPTNNPTTDAAISNRPASDGDTRANCFPKGWGAVNPVNWVMQPVTCAMENLFVPKQSAIPKAQLAIRSAVNNSGIGTMKTNVAGLGLVGFGNGCTGIPLQWSIFGKSFELDLLRACPGDPLAAVAAATHTILSGLVVTLSLLAILRYMAVIFGFQGLGARIERAREEAAAKSGDGS